jgi:non-lysosomal glucosylceramidase
MAYEVTTERQHKPRSGVALGGIGAGWFELRQDGTCENWNIFNNKPLGRGARFPFNPHSVLFFLIRYAEEGKNPRLVLLQIEDSHGAAAFEGHEFQYIFPWLSGVDRIRYSATFPFIKLEFTEHDLPLAVSLEAWSPFIPHDAANSALPLAYFDFSLRLLGSRPAQVSLLAVLRNCVGYDVPRRHHASRIVQGEGHVAFEHGADHLDPAHISAGTMGIASLRRDSNCYLGWEHPHPYYERLLREPHLPDFDDTSSRNVTNPETGEPSCLERCFSTIGPTVRLDEKQPDFAHTFVVGWHFPNNYAKMLGEPDDSPPGYLEDAAFVGRAGGSEAETKKAATKPRHIEGHFYSNRFSSAAEVMAYGVAERERLLRETRRFHEAFYAATVETCVLDQVNSQLNTFRTSTWLTKAGDFGVLEGLSPTQKYAGLATTDVAMYGAVAAAALFPQLDRAMLRAHRRLQNKNGSVVHSIDQNFRDPDPNEASGLRLDMPAQYVYMALRAYFWSGNKDYLREMWPSVQAALEYVLRERDGNGDLLPDMEGVMCSYDNFPMYGVAPYVASQWLAAVSSAAEAAREMGDTPAETKWLGVLEQGSRTVDKTTWNGSYYRLYSDPLGGRGNDEGVLTDQIIGQWATHLVDLPSLLPVEHVRSALRHIMRTNFHPDQGLRNCQWPGDTFLHDVEKDCWVDQANTCWTGVELAFASFLIYEGLVDEGLKLIRQIDSRYRRWGIYWDHQEFGGHYFRPMSAWAIIPALLGFKSRNGVLTFAPRLPDPELRLLFMTADGYGNYFRDGRSVRLEIVSGKMSARILRFALPRPEVDFQLNGEAWRPPASHSEGEILVVTLPENFVLEAGNSLRLTLKD